MVNQVSFTMQIETGLLTWGLQAVRPVGASDGVQTAASVVVRLVVRQRGRVG